jgi:hypothetical protein
MLTIQPVIGEKEILTMNSGSLGKARRGAVRKVVFILALMLVTLVYAATPLTALACDGGNNNNGGGNKPKPGGGVAAADKQATKDLNGGSPIARLTVNGNVVQLADIKPPDKFVITFKDGVKLNAVCVVAGSAADPQATVTLPSGAQVAFRPKPAKGEKVVTPIVNAQAVANGSNQAFSLFLNSSPTDWKLVKLNGSPLNRNAIKKVGQAFKIEKIDNSIAAIKALYIGNGFVLLTDPSTKKLLKLPLSNF